MTLRLHVLMQIGFIFTSKTSLEIAGEGCMLSKCNAEFSFRAREALRHCFLVRLTRVMICNVNYKIIYKVVLLKCYKSCSQEVIHENPYCSLLNPLC